MPGLDSQNDDVRAGSCYLLAVHPLFTKVCADAGWTQKMAAAELALDEGRRQQVIHEVYEEDGEKLVRVYSVVGPAARLDARRTRAALSLNWRLRFGAIAIWEDQLVVTRSFLERDLDADELRLAIEFIARTADEYEHYIFRKDAN